MHPLYLDNNATTFLDPRVADAMHECARSGLANPASQHRAGQAARRRLEAARDRIATLLGANICGMAADRLIFTSGGTEANNLALFGLAGTAPGRVIVSSLEHPSVLAAADQLARNGFEISRIRAHANGVIDVDHFLELLTPDVRLVSVMLANNETGVLQPVGEIIRITAERNIPVHVDAVQVAGKLPVQFHSLGAAAVTIAPHKFHGPVGIGALLLRHDIAPKPLHFGGFQQMGLRPGTESVALAVGFEQALEVWVAEAVERRKRMQQLRDEFEQRLRAALPNFVVHGESADRLPHVTSASFLGLERQSLLMALDRAGIACSAGSACASGSSQPSAVLRAMGLSDDQLASALRFSLSARTTAPEVADAVDRIIRVCNDLRRRFDEGKTPRTPRHSTPKPL